MGRRCLINDCNINEPEPALCCLDCSEHDVCPDRCPKKETTFCVGVLGIGKDKSRVKQEESIVHR